MTTVIPIRRNVPLRELMVGKHERPVTPRERLIDAAVEIVAEHQAEGFSGPINARWFMERWLVDGRAPINSIRSAYRSLS